MSTASARRLRLPQLCHGERLTQKEFHRRYEAYPDHVKAELIGGVVYMASPLRWSPQGTYTSKLSLVRGLYEAATPGVDSADNATAILGEWSEPQPDLALRILPEYGGQTRLDAKGYLVGAPEWIAEVGDTTLQLDLHEKKEDYQRAGGREYLVLAIKEKKLYWFDLKAGREIARDAKGIYRSRVFPGLWIDGPALLARDSGRLIKVIHKGIASPEHAAFVKRLARRRKR